MAKLKKRRREPKRRQLAAQTGAENHGQVGQGQ